MLSQIIHGLLDRVMQLLEVQFTDSGSGYHIKMCDGETLRDIVTYKEKWNL